jgi:hypothetical protein
MIPPVECAGCSETFAYDPARPTKRYHSPECRRHTEETRRARSSAQKSQAAADRNATHEVEFIAVDGEGVTYTAPREVWDDEEGNVVTKMVQVHDYVLLTVGDQSLHRDGRKLHHDEIFRFLYDQFLDHPNAAFVGFFLGYDFSQWFQSIPDLAGWKMFHKDGIASRLPSNAEMKYPFPVYVQNRWEMDILGMKRFKLRPHVKKKDWPNCQVAHKTPDQIEACLSGAHRKHPHKWMYICDTGGFFQTSLMNVINPKKWPTPIVSDQEWSILQAGKDNRSDAQFGEEMMTYNVLENEILARVMDKINEGFVADGIRLARNQWFGPGQAAQAWLRLIGAPTGEDVRAVTPPWALTAAQNTYYGGWFETFIHGVIPGTTYGYDINSAYPYAIANLPCLLHGSWTRGRGRPPKMKAGHFRMIYAKFQGEDPYIGTMPHRDKNGSISRPRETTGWHWQHEVDAARRAGMIKRVTVREWVEYEPCNCPKPIAAIEELYKSRITVGKESPWGKSKKLVYNSTYGKMAQSVGMPKFSNSIYASLIVSTCRTMILDAIATHPDKTKGVAMIATDGIYFLSPHPALDLDNEKLGKWGADDHENLSILMPGLYWDDESRASVKSGSNLKLKSRGVSGKYLAPFMDRFDDAWARLRTSVPEVSEKQIPPDRAPTQAITIEFSVVSPKVATVRDNWEFLCGKIVWGEERMITANPQAKRDHFFRDPDRPELLRSAARWFSSTGELESHGYDRTFGAEMDELRELDDFLIQDGTANDVIHAALPGD